MIIGKSAARSSRRNVGDRLKTMCRQKLRNEVPERGNPLYLAFHGRSVSVRILHDFLRVRCRSKSGSLVHGRISGGISVLGKSAQPLLVAARRGMASKRNGAPGLLPPARDVRTLDEAPDQQGRSPRTCEIPAGFASA